MTHAAAMHWPLSPKWRYTSFHVNFNASGGQYVDPDGLLAVGTARTRKPSNARTPNWTHRFLRRGLFRFLRRGVLCCNRFLRRGVSRFLRRGVPRGADPLAPALRARPADRVCNAAPQSPTTVSCFKAASFSGDCGIPAGTLESATGQDGYGRGVQKLWRC